MSFMILNADGQYWDGKTWVAARADACRFDGCPTRDALATIDGWHIVASEGIDVACTRDADILPGDRVRSYDFPWRRDGDDRPACYVEGTVVGFREMEGCLRYVVDVDTRVWDGVESGPFPGERTVFPPVNGTPSLFGRATCGVTRLGPDGKPVSA